MDLTNDSEINTAANTGEGAVSDNLTPATPDNAGASDEVSALKGQINELTNKFNNYVDQTSDLMADRALNGVNNTNPDPMSIVQNQAPAAGNEDWNERFNADPQSAIEAMVDKRATEKINQMNAVSTATATQNQYDAMAVKEFPQLNDNASDLWKQTRQEIDDMKRMDPKASTRPDLIYSAVHRASNRLSQTKSHVPSTEGRRQTNLSRGNLESGGTGGVVTDGQVSDSRKFIASRMGVNVDIFKK